MADIRDFSNMGFRTHVSIWLGKVELWYDMLSDQHIYLFLLVCMASPLYYILRVSSLCQKRSCLSRTIST